MGKFTLPVLMYHAVISPGTSISIEPENFRFQMKWLSDHGYHAISLRQLHNLLDQSDTLNKKSVLLTFDDGYECLFPNAWPILKEFGFSATVFVVAGRIGKSNNWDPTSAPGSGFPILNWQEIREMDLAGIDFGSHSVSHDRLDRLDSRGIEYELAESKSIIQQELGHSIDSFAYPYGWYNNAVLTIAREFYSTAFSTRVGLVTNLSDRHQLERVEIHYLRHPSLFPVISKPYFPLYIWMRKIARRFGSMLLKRSYQ